eukprot:scaffold662818_cov64-Prasinocladus_malaysianus.AAC.1
MGVVNTVLPSLTMLLLELLHLQLVGSFASHSNAQIEAWAAASHHHPPEYSHAANECKTVFVTMVIGSDEKQLER